MKSSRSRLACAVVTAIASLTGCSPPVDNGDVARPDVLHDATQGPCITDRDCDDSVFCNGSERCMPGVAGADARGCVAPIVATPCLPSQTCVEAQLRCRSDCARDPDADGDGHRAAECGGDDCDDSDANRFPGNAEVCDGSHDEDCIVVTVGSRDNDHDGFDDRACCNVVPGSAVSCGEDCDDTRAEVNPRSPEVCNGVDDNCNGLVDEGLPVRAYYPDCDGDGFGDAAAMATMACSVPITTANCASPGAIAAWSTSHDDCVDSDDSVHVGVPELCDGVDNNCDGATDENPVATRSCGLVANATAACMGAQCTVASCSTGFTDCDRIFGNGCETDLQTSSSHCGACGTRCAGGEACIAGVCQAVQCPLGLHACAGRCVSSSAPDHCGNSCMPCPSPAHGHAVCDMFSGACGVQCDAGYLDRHGECAAEVIAFVPHSGAVVHASQPRVQFACDRCDSGTLHICSDVTCASSTSFPGTSFEAMPDALSLGVHYWFVETAVTHMPPRPFEMFVAHAPPTSPARLVEHMLFDLDGDGAPDVGIGAPASTSTGGGSVSIYPGTANGVATTMTALLAAPDATPSFGASVARLGDVNGDGFGDLVVGAPDADGGNGRAFLYFGSSSGVDAARPVGLTSIDLRGHFGRTIAGGDFDGDGFEDIAVTSLASGRGASVSVFFGRPSGVGLAPDRVDQPYGPIPVGEIAALAPGDINGDGYTDLLFGIPTPDTTTSPSAASSVGILWGYEGVEGPAGYVFTQTGWTLGEHVAVAGDVDGDGYEDVVVTARSGSTERVLLFLGNNFGTPQGPITIDAPSGATDFGHGLGWCGDLNGDGLDDIVIGSPGNASIAWVFGRADMGTQTSLTLDGSITLGTSADGTGASVIGVGDVTRDGFADVVVGADASMTTGRAFLLEGGATGLATTSRATFASGDINARAFGRSLAMRAR